MHRHPLLRLLALAALLAAPLAAEAQEMTDAELLRTFRAQREAFRAAAAGEGLGRTRSFELLTVEDLSTAPEVSAEAEAALQAAAGPEASPSADAPSADASPQVQVEVAGIEAPAPGEASTGTPRLAGAEDGVSVAGAAALAGPAAGDEVGAAVELAAAPAEGPRAPGAVTVARLAPELQVNVRVAFGFDSAVIATAEIPKLDRLCRVMRESGIGLFRIVGHTDASGGDAYNERLSLLRAQEVRRWLVDGCGLPPGSLEALGMGERLLLDVGRPDAPENRRVEFQALS